MDKPTAAELRADERINTFLLASGFPVADPDTALQDEIDLAWAYVGKRTCRDLASLDPVTQEADVLIATRAITLRLYQQIVQESADYSESALDDNIKSFSVPGYSETRGDGAKSMQESWRLNPLAPLHDLLRLLITDDCWQRHLEDVKGEDAPYSQVVEVDWFSFPYTNP